MKPFGRTPVVVVSWEGRRREEEVGTGEGRFTTEEEGWMSRWSHGCGTEEDEEEERVSDMNDEKADFRGPLGGSTEFLSGVFETLLLLMLLLTNGVRLSEGLGKL